MLTNTTGKTRAAIAERLAGIGYDLPVERITTAASAAAEHLRSQHAGERVYALVERGAVGELDGIELVEDPGTAEVVLLGGPDESWTYGRLNAVFRVLLGGVPLVAMQQNRWWPTADGPALDAGMFVVGLSYAAATAAGGGGQALDRDLPQRLPPAGGRPGGGDDGGRRPGIRSRAGRRARHAHLPRAHRQRLVASAQPTSTSIWPTWRRCRRLCGEGYDFSLTLLLTRGAASDLPGILRADAPPQPQHRVRHVGDPPAALQHLARLALTGPGPREWCAQSRRAAQLSVRLSDHPRGFMHARTLTIFRLYQLFNGIIFTGPIWAVYLLSRGLTLTQFGLVEAALHVGMLVAQVPTGALADALGRRRLLVAAGFFTAVGELGYVYAPGFGLICLAGAIHGVAFALRTGADEAYLFDALAHDDAQAQFPRMLGGLWAVFQFASAISFLAGGLIATWSRPAAFWLTAICALIASAIAQPVARTMPVAAPARACRSRAADLARFVARRGWRC